MDSNPQATSSPRPPPAGTVLLVEDDGTTRARLSHLLGLGGYQVIEVGRLSDARAALQNHSPDLILMDGLLPDGMGVDLVSELRRAGSKARVLFLSSFFKDFRSMMKLLKDLKVSGILHKPVDAGALMAHVRDALAA